MKKQKNCGVCNTELSNKTSYLNGFKHDLFENRTISICMDCGFGQINTKLSNNNLNDYYENIYRGKNSPMHLDFSSHSLDMNMLDFRSISQLLLGRQYISYKKVYSFLDIGPGPGGSLISAKQIFKNVKLSVIELSVDAQNFYKKYFKDLSIYKNLDEIENEIDILLMSHSLEHFNVNDMSKLFEDMHNVLADDGIIIIEIPHADLRNSSYLKGRINDTPHLSFFSLESLSKLIDKSKFHLCFINTVGDLFQNPFLEEALVKKRQNIISSRSDFSISKAIRQVSRFFGFFGYLRKVSAILDATEKPYRNVNFQYGGNRDGIRLVLKKK